MDVCKIMEEYDVNEEQARALDIDKNIALHAGAGSGKTRVLSRRFLRLALEKDADIQSIVAITFTNKAALEMRERIRSLINEKILKAKDPQQLQKLKRLREEIQRANIGTFHSFCDRILRENCHVVGLDPMYRIIEDVDRETLLSKIIREEINKIITERILDEEFKKLFELYGTDYYYKEGLMKDVKHLYDKMREKALSIDELRQHTMGNIARFYKENNMECFEEACMLEEVQLFIVTILEKIDESFKKYKLEKGLVDFNDLEIFTVKLLENGHLREHYRRRFKYFLVDEFQDTNRVQKKILYYLLEENDGRILPGRLFIVGDVKQAIYGFRGADYEVFNAVTEKIIENGEKRELSTCYRSHPDIVNMVNRIFSNLFSNFEPLKNVEGYEGSAGVEFSLLERKKEGDGLWKSGKGVLKNGNRQEVKKFLDELLGKGKDERQEDVAGTMEAEKLALKVKELVDEGYEYKDMAVLLRNRTNLSQFEEALRKHGIPYCVIGGIGFFEKREIVDIMNILKCVYNPDDKAAMLGALRSPYIGVSDDLLFEVFDHFFDEDVSKESSKRFDKPAALGLLREMRQRARYYNISDFVNLITDRFHIKEIMLSFENGAAMYRNMEKFIGIAREFDEKDIYSPSDFFDYIQSMKEVSAKEAEAVLDTEDSNAVKIMTIHAAKGLEFEAVLIPEIGRDVIYNTRKSKPCFLFHDGFGVIARFDEKIANIKGAENRLYDFVREKFMEKELEEAVRMLYVAATRARRYLCFSGEDVELKDDDKLDCFVKMLKTALNEEVIVSEGVGNEKRSENEDVIYKEYICGNDDVTGISEGDFSGKAHENTGKNHLNASARGMIESIFKKIEFVPEYKIKSSFSISRYFTFTGCPRKFFYIYKAGLKGTHFESDIELKAGTDDWIFASSQGVYRGATKGKLIHEILEKVKENKSDMEDAIRGYIGKCFADNDIREIKRLIQNYVVAESEYEKTVVGSKIKTDREKAFAVPLLAGGGKVVYGIIDRIDIYDSGGTPEAYLIDYKTNRIKSSDDMEILLAHYKPQFILYRLGFEKLYTKIYENIKLKGMFLFFLDVAKAVPIWFDWGESAEFISRLSSIIDYIESHNDMEDYRCCQPCEYMCEFASLCK